MMSAQQHQSDILSQQVVQEKMLYTIQTDGLQYQQQQQQQSNGPNDGGVGEEEYISHHEFPGQHSNRDHLHEDDTNTNNSTNYNVYNNTNDEQHQETSKTEGTEAISDFSAEPAEPVKLFVGQVPKSMEEADLFPIFEKYGPMQDVAIIRDKHTGQHRGCAFVTFFSQECADACETELHNKFMFEGGKRAVQIRPAGRKDEIENKVFVGMLPRNVEEDTVRQLFEPYGEIKGIFLIRSTDGIKKGCAFVKYSERESAMAAIQSLHGTHAIEDSDRPLIVKIADNKNKKKERLHHPHNGMYPDHHQHHQERHVTHSSQASFNGYYMHPPSSHVQHHPPHVYQGHVPPSNSASPAGSYSSGGQFPASYGNGTTALPPPQPQSYIYEQMPFDVSSHFQDCGGAPQAGNQRPREGPAGANLFIYHLPHDLTDADLATAFNPFGNVISAKVYVDKFTGESKGFGFVSYDSIISAEHAIEQMNGFQIGNKRLKVQHKRVNRRPPVSVPTMHQHPYYHGRMPHQVPYHDVPPAIEISGPIDNMYANSHIPSNDISQTMLQQEIDGLTSRFEHLNKFGDEHQQH